MFKVYVSELCSIQKAVELCREKNGGCVVVPEGVWKTGPIHMSSHIHLVIEENAEVVFSDEPDDYLPVVFTRWEGVECFNYSPLIYARDSEDISISGSGILNGNGSKWWQWKQLQQKAADELVYAQMNGIAAEDRVYGTKKAALRPSFIQFINCRNIVLEDFTITEGPQWTIHPVYCRDVEIRKVTVRTSGPNTDGLNPDSCQNVIIDNCSFETGDDCIAINAGMNEDGWRVAEPCRNIEIRNCRMSGGHGGIVIGSAVSGGVSDIYAHDIVIDNTMQGIRMKTMRGRGGYAENIRFENIEINNTSCQAVTINMFYEFSTVVPGTQTPSVFRSIEIKNIHGSGNAEGIVIKGLPESPVEDLVLENIDLKAQTAFTCSDTRNLKITNVIVDEK